MSQRNKAVNSKAENWPFQLTYPTQDEINAYVREAHRMRAEAVGRMLVGLWRRLTGRKSRPVAAPSLPAKA